MNPTDLLIIYLAFGAPIAVYKYLQSRSSRMGRRVASSAWTFCFWIPAAVRIGYLYFTNANLADAFVSHRAEENEQKKIDAVRDQLATELLGATEGLSMHDVRDTIERYAGLAPPLSKGGFEELDSHPLLEAAGRLSDTTGAVCLNRRNRNRLERHHKWARQDFLMLFEYLQEQHRATTAYDLGVELTRRLKDDVAHKALAERRAKWEAIWMREHDAQSTEISTKHVTALSVRTPSMNRD